MGQTCIDKILCENAWGCNILVTDNEGNPIDTSLLQNEDSVVFVLEDKPGYLFNGWIDENGNKYIEGVDYTDNGDNTYLFSSINCSKRYLALYVAISYTIGIDSEPSSVFAHYDIEPCYYGDVVTISAQEYPYSHFLRWQRGDEVVSYQPSFDYVVTENVDFVAYYDTVEFRLTVIPDNKNRGYCEGSGTYIADSVIQISAHPYQGFIFTSWDDGDTNEERDVIVNSNKTYTAYFRRNLLMLTIEQPSEGGEGIGGGEYLKGSVASIQAIPDLGWEFDYWEIDGVQYTESTMSLIMQSAMEVSPHFRKSEYVVNAIVKPDGFGYLNPSPLSSYEYGDSAVIDAMPNQGYRFVEWGDGYKGHRREFEVVNNVEMVAYFEELPHQYVLIVLLPDNRYDCGIYYGYTNVASEKRNTYEYDGNLVYYDNGMIVDAYDGSVIIRDGTVIDGKTVSDIIELSSINPNTIPSITIIFTDTSTDDTIVHYQGVSVRTMGLEGSVFQLSPIPPKGDTITQIEKDGVVIWDNNTSRGDILYTMTNSDALLEAISNVSEYTLTVSISPLNTETSENVDLSVSVNGVADSFTPSIATPSKQYTNVGYGTSIVLEAPDFIDNTFYKFGYWRTGIGSFTTPQVSLNMSKTMVCNAVYDYSKVYDSKVEYLIFTGEQYIDTNILGTNLIEVQSRFKPTALGGFLYGAESTDNLRSFTAYIDTNGYWLNGDEHVRIPFTTNSVLWYNSTQNESGVSIVEGFVSNRYPYPSPPSDYHTPYTILIGSAHTSPGCISPLGFNGYVGHTVIISDGNTVLDLMPVRVGRVGYMYDTITRTLYGNGGKGVIGIGTDITEFEQET